MPKKQQSSQTATAKGTAGSSTSTSISTSTSTSKSKTGNGGNTLNKIGSSVNPYDLLLDDEPQNTQATQTKSTKSTKSTKKVKSKAEQAETAEQLEQLEQAETVETADSAEQLDQTDDDDGFVTVTSKKGKKKPVIQHTPVRAPIKTVPVKSPAPIVSESDSDSESDSSDEPDVQSRSNTEHKTDKADKADKTDKTDRIYVPPSSSKYVYKAGQPNAMHNATPKFGKFDRQSGYDRHDRHDRHDRYDKHDKFDKFDKFDKTDHDADASTFDHKRIYTTALYTPVSQPAVAVRGDDFSLNAPWKVWIHENDSRIWNLESYRSGPKIETISQMLRTLYDFESLNKRDYQYFIMRNEIAPIWEDINNKDGVITSIKINIGNRESCDIGSMSFKVICMLVLNESFVRNNTDINGVCYSIKNNSPHIKFWVKDRSRNSTFERELPMTLLRQIEQIVESGRKFTNIYRPNTRPVSIMTKNIEPDE